MGRKGVHLPVIENPASDASSEENEVMESNVLGQEEKDDLWDLIIDYTYEKMCEKL